MRLAPTRCSIAAALLLAAALADAPALAFDVPYLSGRIVDEAGLLSDSVEQSLDQRLAALESETGAQVAVLTVATLDGDPIEDASMRVVETWKLGRAEQDDGVLLLVARDDRALRIEVGYGLEGTLPDARARRIVDNAIVPKFKAGDFEGGIEVGVAEIEKAIRGEADTLPQTAVGSSSGGDALGGGCFFLFFLAFITPFAYAAVATRGFAGWFLVLFLTPFFLGFSGALGEALMIPAAIAWLVVATIARLLWPARWRIDSTSRSGRGGAFWGGGGGGFSSGGGGFSGGGGSFGGGGASGSW